MIPRYKTSQAATHLQLLPLPSLFKTSLQSAKSPCLQMSSQTATSLTPLEIFDAIMTSIFLGVYLGDIHEVLRRRYIPNPTPHRPPIH